MNTKVLLAALAGGVAYFLLGWLLYGILLDPYFRSMTTPEGLAVQRAPEEMVMWAIALSNLVYALMLAIIFNRWASISTFQGGAIAGGIIGFLMALSVDLSMYSMLNLWTGMAGLIVDPLVSGVMGALVGGIIGWVLGYGKKG